MTVPQETWQRAVALITARYSAIRADTEADRATFDVAFVAELRDLFPVSTPDDMANLIFALATCAAMLTGRYDAIRDALLGVGYTDPDEVMTGARMLTDLGQHVVRFT